MDHNESLDAVDWARAPVAEELYDNSKMDEKDLDSSDAINLLLGLRWSVRVSSGRTCETRPTLI